MKKNYMILCILSAVITTVYINYDSLKSTTVTPEKTQAPIVIEPSQSMIEIVAEDPSAKQGAEKTVTPEYLSELVRGFENEHQDFEVFINTKPSSLSDVPAPSVLDLDQYGQLITNFKLKNLFEYYLSSLGEETLDRVVLRIKNDLENQLEGDNLDKSLSVLEGYLQYRNHLGILKNDFANNNPEATYSLADVRYVREQAMEARLSFFDEETIQGFFGKNDEYDDYTLTRAEIKSDTNLTNEEKDAQLKTLEEHMPDWLDQINAKSISLNETRESLSTFRKNGATEDEIKTLIEDVYDEQAAERVIALEERRKAWAEKLEVYRSELNALVEGQGASQFDPQYLDELRSIFFDETEIVRVRSLDKRDLNI